MVEWTPEARAEAGERLKAGRAAAAARRENGGDDTPTVSPEQMLIAATTGKKEVTDEDIFKLQSASGASGERAPEHQSARVTHQSGGLVRLYKPTPQGYRPRRVPAANLPMLIRNGWLAACPDCGRANCSINGKINDCPGRAPRLYRTCPIVTCGKVFEDPAELEGPGLATDSRVRDPNEIQDGAYATSTPETRTLAMWRSHMLAVHPQEAATAGIAPLVQQAVGMQPQVGTEAGVR